jgi:hypothetical protein
MNTAKSDCIIGCGLYDSRVSFHALSNDFGLTGLKFIVFIYAFAILCHNRWKLRRYSIAKSATTDEKNEQGGCHEGCQIPFGARALESGVKVEGIWISYPGTPLTSPQQQPLPVVS